MPHNQAIGIFSFFREMPILSRFVAFIILPVIIGLVGSYQYYSHSAEPQLGQLSVAGISAPLSISRDKNGVPFIRAASDNDAFFAIGYAHAQDRLWQLETQKRMAQGRLSEILGKATVSHDVWFRTLGLHLKAKSAWQTLSPKAQQALQSYVLGINTYIDSTSILPPEFTMLDVNPSHWTVYDCLAWVKVFALNLSGNLTQETSFLLASQKLSEQQLITLFGDYAKLSLSGGEPQAKTLQLNEDTVKNLASVLRQQQRLTRDFGLGGKYAGSNAWVVAPQHTDSGSSILANDPHLGLHIPSLWYVANIKGDKLNVKGMTLVGLPLVIFGQNQNIAWGGTAMMTDNQDLFIEQVNQGNPNQYQYDGAWKNFESREEIIHVKADFPAAMRKAIKPITINVRSTVNGPVISDFYPVFQQPVSLRWTALDNDDTTFESFFRLNYAMDWQSFQSALHHQVAPAINMMYSDRQGNIGYLGAGRVPLRPDNQGLISRSGSDPRQYWLGHVSPHNWPSEFNPERGYIVNANNEIIPDKGDYYLSAEWAPSERADRIENMILALLREPKSVINSEDMKVIQGDTLSLGAQKLLPLLRNVQADNGVQKEALQYLQNWQGQMATESPAAALYNGIVRELRVLLFEDELESYWGKYAEQEFISGLIAQTSVESINSALTQPDSVWCDDVSTTDSETCEQQIVTAIQKTIHRFTKLKGSDMDSWVWQDMHFSRYEHLPFSQVKLLDYLFEKRLPNSGSEDTVNVAASDFVQSEGYLQNFGATFRQIMSPGSGSEQHWFMNSTGQSGNIFSEHYSDMIEPFNDVAFDTLPDISSDERKLVLRPLN